MPPPNFDLSSLSRALSSDMLFLCCMVSTVYHSVHFHYQCPPSLRVSESVQKTIMCDSALPDSNSQRQVVAFVGGLDVTKGRYDTPEHPIYPPDDRFHEDFRQV